MTLGSTAPAMRTVTSASPSTGRTSGARAPGRGTRSFMAATTSCRRSGVTRTVLPAARRSRSSLVLGPGPDRGARRGHVHGTRPRSRWLDRRLRLVLRRRRDRPRTRRPAHLQPPGLLSGDPADHRQRRQPCVLGAHNSRDGPGARSQEARQGSQAPKALRPRALSGGCRQRRAGRGSPGAPEATKSGCATFR